MDKKLPVRRLQMDCPLCGKIHKVEEWKRKASILIKEEEIAYEERFYLCEYADEEENEFESGAMMNANLLRARNAYRRKHGLLTSEEIVKIREAYGMSQVDLARLLGWGEATVSRYESKAIQEEAYDHMLRLIQKNPLQVLEFLDKNKEKFSGSRWHLIRKRALERKDSDGKEYLTRQAVEAEYASFYEPSDLNGNTCLNIDKLEAMVSYLAEGIPNLFKTKLMKLLWYADVLSFQRTNRAMTGLVYRHEPMGALPVGHYRLMNLENIRVQEEMSANYDSMFHIYPNKALSLSVLNDEEREILDALIKKFRIFRTDEIVAYMHRERAYLETKPGDKIPFHLAADLREFIG